jgi:hypothetical protein
MLQAGRARVQFPVRTQGLFSLPKPSIRTMALGVDSPSNSNEYQESSWGQRVRLAASLPSVS